MKDKLRLGFDISMEKGATWRPMKVEFWSHEHLFSKVKPSPPFKYMADALMGLSMVKLNHYIKSPIATPHLNYSDAVEAWKHLDPHVELYERSEARVRSLQSHTPVLNPEYCREFETLFNETFDSALKPWGMDLTELWPLLDTFQWLETKMDGPLLYSLSLNFSKPFMDKLHSLYSFLYHLRGVVAVDHNAHCDDPSHEGVKMDAITDYLPRAEYVVNDALLYWNFKKWAGPFSGPKTPDSRVENLLVRPMEKAFNKYSHNACRLIESLPTSFVEKLNPLELEEALYLVQMDWLLGSPAGLLFKIREEIYALQNGYEKIFWKDVEPQFTGQNFKLQVSCEVNPDHEFENSAA